MLLTEIVWPVYSLGKTCPSKEGNIIYFSRNTIKGVSLQIIDDTSISGDSLAVRRLKLLSQNVPLYKIKYAIFFLADLVKLAKPNNWFIDSAGKLFNYKKKVSAKLVFKKITNVIKSTGVSLIEVEGQTVRYSCLYPPTPEQKYAGLLKVGSAYVLYGFYEVQHKNTYRKI